MSGIVVQGFDVLVDRYRQHAGLTRDIASHHQHDAKFTHCMGKGQHTPSEIPPLCHGQHHVQPPVSRGRTQRRRRFEHGFRHGPKRRLQRLHHKWQGIDNRSNDQSRERERQGLTGQLDPKTPHGRLGIQHDQQIKTEHRRR